MKGGRRKKKPRVQEEIVSLSIYPLLIYYVYYLIEEIGGERERRERERVRERKRERERDRKENGAKNSMTSITTTHM